MTSIARSELPDLSTLSLAELKTLGKQVAKQIANFEERQKKAALAEVEAKAKEMGFSLTELVAGGTRGKQTKSVGVAKYGNPENADQTWTGKGRRPAWFVAALQSGVSAEDMEL